MNFKFKKIEIDFWYNNQIGLMVNWGINAMRKKYVSLDIPFLIIFISW